MIYLLPRSSQKIFDGLPDYFGYFGNIHNVDRGFKWAIKSGKPWALDNGVFSGKFDDSKFTQILEKHIEYIPTCLFVVCPDVVGDSVATNVRWKEYSPRIHEIGYKVAFAAQDGQEKFPLPDNYDALFIGGSTKFKYTEGVRRMVAEAKAMGKWTHMGRVNTLRRIMYCRELGIDSVDGTFIIFAPDRNMKMLKYFMHSDRIEDALKQPRLI